MCEKVNIFDYEVSTHGQEPTRFLMFCSCFLLAVLFNSLLADLAACRHVIEVKILTELRGMLSKQIVGLFQLWSKLTSY